MISSYLPLQVQMILPIRRLSIRFRQWQMSVTEHSGMPIMNGKETCIFWNRRAAYTAENMHRNISITGCAGSGSREKRFKNRVS